MVARVIRPPNIVSFSPFDHLSAYENLPLTSDVFG